MRHTRRSCTRHIDTRWCTTRQPVRAARTHRPRRVTRQRGTHRKAFAVALLTLGLGASAYGSALAAVDAASPTARRHDGARARACVEAVEAATRNAARAPAVEADAVALEAAGLLAVARHVLGSEKKNSGFTAGSEPFLHNLYNTVTTTQT